MSIRQRFIIWGWIAVVVAAGVYPPWEQRAYPSGYHLIFAPPRGQAIHVDQSRLTVEWIICTVVAAGLYFAWPLARTRTRPSELPKPQPSPRRPSTEPEESLRPLPVKIMGIIILIVVVCGVITSVVPDRPPPKATGTAPQTIPAAALSSPSIDYDALAEKFGGKVATASPGDSQQVGRLEAADEQPKSVVSRAYVRPAFDPNGDRWPTVTDYLVSSEHGSGDGCDLTVDNGMSDSDKFVRVYDHHLATPLAVRAFLVKAGDQFTAEHLVPGGYDIRFEDLDSGVISKSEVLSLYRTTDPDGAVIFHDKHVTLYKIRYSTKQSIRFDVIGPDEFR